MEKQTIFVGVLAYRSIMNISLDCCFNIRTKEVSLMKYLHFSHFVSFAGDSQCRPDPSCFGCMTRTKQNSKSLKPLLVEEEWKNCSELCYLFRFNCQERIGKVFILQWVKEIQEEICENQEGCSLLIWFGELYTGRLPEEERNWGKIQSLKLKVQVLDKAKKKINSRRDINGPTSLLLFNNSF